MLFGGEINFEETAGELAGGFLANLATQAGFVARSLNRAKFTEEFEKNRFEKIPIFSAASKQATQPEFFAPGLVNIDGGKVSLAAGGDVEA